MASCRAHFSSLKVYRYVILFKIILNDYWLRSSYYLQKDEHIKATLKNGLLTVTFPRSLPELAAKKIVIQTTDKEEYHTDFNV